MRKIILSIIGILLIVASFFYAKKLIADKNKPKPVQAKVVKTVFTDTIQNNTIQIIIADNGSLEAKRRVEIYSEVQGVFKQGSKLFKPGQQYSAGQTLIKIDADEYYASVQSSKSNLYNSIAAIMPDLRLDFPVNSIEFRQAQLNLLNAELSRNQAKFAAKLAELDLLQISGQLLDVEF